VSTQQRVTCQS